MIGDAYFECGKVALPYCDNPKVSIIIPCYNQIRYTYKCIYSIVQNTNVEDTPYEVIIADDVSTDTTKNIKKYVENVVVNRNKENLGFLKNCNEAAKLARGEYIYFLNNDTEVHSGYLSSLVSLLDNNSSIGMVGSKLVYADGTLQEAGGIIWSDGEGANYGRGDDPEDFKYNYVKEVDYISGAAIMIRKNLWNIIGGFDERYAPAYCEDSDLAFEVRKYGYKVVYQPLSVVTHFEGISNGTDENNTDSIKSYQVTNKEKLKEKWQNELTEQYPHTDSLDFFRARERGMRKKTILFIDHYVPTWDKDAGSKTVYSYMMIVCGVNIIIGNWKPLLVFYDIPINISFNSYRLSICYTSNLYPLDCYSFLLVQPDRIVVKIRECLGCITAKFIKSLLQYSTYLEVYNLV
jgi:GT2 family glycosyltransferase